MHVMVHPKYGNEVHCPVCERDFRKFLSYGSNTVHRENVLCPYDLTLERHRLMWLYLKKSSFFEEEIQKVLHIAPEQCFYPIFKKQKNLNYTTADMESPIADLHFDLHRYNDVHFYVSWVIVAKALDGQRYPCAA